MVEDHINNCRGWQIKANLRQNFNRSCSAATAHSNILRDDLDYGASFYDTLVNWTRLSYQTEPLFLALKTLRFPGRTLNTDATFDPEKLCLIVKLTQLLGMKYKLYIWWSPPVVEPCNDVYRILLCKRFFPHFTISWNHKLWCSN